MSQAFQYIAQFEHFTDLNLFICHSKLGNGCFTILFDGAYFLLAVSLEGDESSRLRMANYVSSFGRLLALIDSPACIKLLMKTKGKFDITLRVTPCTMHPLSNFPL